VEGLSEEPVHGVEDVVRLMVQVSSQTLDSAPLGFCADLLMGYGGQCKGFEMQVDKDVV
jgi:hypothetical protein